MPYRKDCCDREGQDISIVLSNVVSRRNKTAIFCSRERKNVYVRRSIYKEHGVIRYSNQMCFLRNNHVLFCNISTIHHSITAVDGEIPDINFRENGYLYLSNYKGKEILERNNATQRSCGADWIDLLSPRELGEHLQYLLYLIERLS
jgi:hypothetical protein